MIPFVQHRGPIHSILMALIVFIPIFAVYHKKAAPYLLALIQHSLVGDYIGGGPIQLLWPLTTQSFRIEMDITSQTNVTIEWVIFLASMIIMFKTKDMAAFFQPYNSNMTLSIPTFTVLLPTFLSFPLEVPVWLTPPHLVYAFIFSASIILDIFKILKSI